MTTLTETTVTSDNLTSDNLTGGNLTGGNHASNQTSADHTTTDAPAGRGRTGRRGTSCLELRGDAKELFEAVSTVASVVPAKSPRPVLQNLLLDARDGLLELTGTDLDVAVRIRVERVEVLSEGRLLVNASRFQQILREMVGEQVSIAADERAGCIVTTGDARIHVMGEEPEDYPELGAFPAAGLVRLEARELGDMIRRTHFAAHPEKTRYAMNGVLLDLKDRRLRLVATDGKRLSMCERPLGFEVQAPVFVVVPTKGMTLLARVLGDCAGGEGDQAGEQVELAVEGSQVFLRTGAATLSARLVEGHFPPYEDVLPAPYERKVRVVRDSFVSSLRRASLLGTKDSQAVRFRFAREGLQLTSRVPEVGESRVTYPIDYPYEALEIGFNPTYFSDALKVLDTTEVQLEVKDPRSPCVIREPLARRGGEGEAGEGRFVYLVMPLNLGA